MQFKNPLIAVKDLQASKDFYHTVLGLQVILDFGANVTLTGGVCLQTLGTWKTFLETDEIVFEGRDAELYFEEDNFDAFAAKLNRLNLRYVHPVKEHSWGQRVVRFYDPDGHIIEVGENMKSVCHRFQEIGMTPEQTAQRMDVPPEFVNDCLK